MTIAYTSDLHLDFYMRETNPQSPKFNTQIDEYITKILKPKPADAIVIAGDISHYNQQSIAVLTALKQHYPEVICTWGNHDAYCISNSIKEHYNCKSINRINELKQLCKANGIHMLDGDIVTINNKTIAGLPMWYNLPTPEHLQHWAESMNDSNHIIDGYDASPYQYSKRFLPFNTQAFYLDQVAKLKALPTTDLLFTHICPSPTPLSSKDPRYGASSFDIFYESTNAHLVKAPICIFGHTHHKTKFTNLGTTYYCNPIGYPSEGLPTSIELLEI